MVVLLLVNNIAANVIRVRIVADAILEERFLNKKSIIDRISPIIKIWSTETEKKIKSKHKKSGDFIERQVVKLQRKYSKDELVSFLTKSIKDKDFKIGELTSEIDELKYKVKNLNKSISKGEIKVARKELSKDKMNQLRNNRLKKLKSEVERYKRANDELIQRLNDSKVNA